MTPELDISAARATATDELFIVVDKAGEWLDVSDNGGFSVWTTQAAAQNARDSEEDQTELPDEYSVVRFVRADAIAERDKRIGELEGNVQHLAAQWVDKHVEMREELALKDARIAAQDAEIATLRQENSEMSRMLAEPSENQELKARIAELSTALKVAREAIENAPHKGTCTWCPFETCKACGYGINNHPRGFCSNAPEYEWMPQPPRPCNCWKHAALAAIKAAEEQK